MLGSEMLVGQSTVYGMFAGEALDGWNPDVVLTDHDAGSVCMWNMPCM